MKLPAAKVNMVPGKSEGNGSYDYLIKLLLIGDSGVGKSCLLMRFCDDAFTPSFITTIGIDFKVRTIEVDGKKVKLQIWDTAGQERFRTISTVYYRGAMGIMLMYDITDIHTFRNLEVWAKTIATHSNEDVNQILIGNKCDMKEKRQVGKEMGEAKAKEMGIPFAETSARTSEGVVSTFLTITRAAQKQLINFNQNTNILENALAEEKPLMKTIKVEENKSPQESWDGGCCT